MKEKIIEMLEGIVVDFDANDEELISSGRMTSLDVIQLLVALGDEFDVEIPATAIKESNFDSVDAIVNLVRKTMDE